MHKSAEYDLSLSYEMHHGLRESARPHVEDSDGRLTLLDVSPIVSPGQDGYLKKGNRISSELVKNIAEGIVPGFNGLVDELLESQTENLKRNADILEKGENVAVATNHAQLTDIAFAQGAILCAMEEAGLVDDIREVKTSVVISKALAYVGIKANSEEEMSVPTVGALGWIIDDVYLSFPETKTLRSHMQDSDKDLIDRHNQFVTDGIREMFDEGGQLFGVAPSGGKDRPDKNTGVHNMRKVTYGTSLMLAHPKTHIQPTMIWMPPGDKPCLDLIGSPEKLRDPDDIHIYMGKIATELNDQVEDKKFKYY